MTDRRLRLGERGEQLAAQWYQDRGYRVVDRNWRCRAGEIDLVVEGEGVVVFCEVKTRSSSAYGGPFAAVGHAKQTKLRELALEWLAQCDTPVPRFRFDVAGVMGREVEIIQSAF